MASEKISTVAQGTPAGPHHVDLEERPGAREAHNPGPFLPTGSLFSPPGQPNSSTLVAVPLFLLLTSLTYVVFKLSPGSVAKGCVCLSVNVFVCACGGVW